MGHSVDGRVGDKRGGCCFCRIQDHRWLVALDESVVRPSPNRPGGRSRPAGLRLEIVKYQTTTLTSRSSRPETPKGVPGNHCNDAIAHRSLVCRLPALAAAAAHIVLATHSPALTA